MTTLYFNQKNIALSLLIALAANLLVGGILLPYQTANAQMAVIDVANLGENIAKYVLDAGQWAWQQVSAAYNNAQATITAVMEMWNQSDTILQRALEAAWAILKRQLLNMLVDDIVQWVQGGGKPKLVTDWQAFLVDAADKAGGTFVQQYLGMGFLCNRFSIQLRIALAQVPKFDFNKYASCSISKIVSNVNSFLNDFNNGGWTAWISLNEMPNNFYGAYLLALDQKLSLEAQAREAAKNEAIASAGFLGDKVCNQSYVTNPDGSTSDVETLDTPQTADQLAANETCTNWQIRTPGKIAADAISKAAFTDIDWLISADDAYKYVGAILDAAINRMIREGVTGLKNLASNPGGSSNPQNQGTSGVATNPSVSTNLDPYNDALQNRDQAGVAINQMQLLKDNLNQYLTEQQTNLGILQQIRPLQIQNATTAQACGLAPAATVDIDGEIASVTTDINNTQIRINQILGAITNAQNYVQAANNYLTAYENLQRGTGTTAQLQAAESAMWPAKTTAVASAQRIIPSNSPDFQSLTQQIMQASLQVVQQTGQLRANRGIFTSCAYVQPNSYYAWLCAAQATQASLVNCLNNGGGAAAGGG